MEKETATKAREVWEEREQEAIPLEDLMKVMCGCPPNDGVVNIAPRSSKD